MPGAPDRAVLLPAHQCDDRRLSHARNDRRPPRRGVRPGSYCRLADPGRHERNGERFGVGNELARNFLSARAVSTPDRCSPEGLGGLLCTSTTRLKLTKRSLGTLQVIVIGSRELTGAHSALLGGVSTASRITPGGPRSSSIASAATARTQTDQGAQPHLAGCQEEAMSGLEREGAVAGSGAVDTCPCGSIAKVVSGRPKRSLTRSISPRSCQLACSELRSPIKI
jgi:hypothetical protein